MRKAIVGARIRERRRALRMTQVELARRIGISPSYVNLIEHNKRGIAGGLLRRAAEALNLDLNQLDGAAEHRLLEILQEIAHSPALQSMGAEAESAEQLIGRYPGWARALAALSRSEHEANEAARALADRLTHDPFLGETVHRSAPRRKFSLSSTTLRRKNATVSIRSYTTKARPLRRSARRWRPISTSCRNPTAR
jgi:transcriptional regulator with XRE-family HTH domain